MLAAVVFFSCNESAKTDDSTSKNADAKALYEKNLATLKSSITAFENEKIDDWAASIADNAVWNPPAYGAKPAGKTEWKNAFTAYFADWDSLKLVDPAFLPGIDSTTQANDGSVRYYGVWAGKHKSGAWTKVKFYATYDFNKDNKVVSANEYFDLGGLSFEPVAPGQIAPTLSALLWIKQPSGCSCGAPLPHVLSR